ncbi:MAG: ATP-binding cassette domain-containing protein [bacterium]|nr:ATP-binding cassette domain-containing protein [bacterium]
MSLSNHQIQFKGVVKGYLKKEPILSNLNLSVACGEFLYLTGASGAGKTTLFKLLMGLELPDAGEVYFEGHSVTALKPKAMPAHRRQFGMIFQDYKLLEKKTARDNISLPLLISGLDLEETRRRIDDIALKLDMDHILDQPVQSLSGGEQQLVAIARASVHNPSVILADEPTANLDQETAQRIYEILVKLNQGGTTVILATHNLSLIKKHPQRTLLIREGRLLEVQR